MAIFLICLSSPGFTDDQILVAIDTEEIIISD